MDYATMFGQNQFQPECSVPQAFPIVNNIAQVSNGICFLVGFAFLIQLNAWSTLSVILINPSLSNRLFAAFGFISATMPIAPAITAAFGWAPHIPPKPEVTRSKHFSIRTVYLNFLPAFNTVIVVPWTIP